MALRPRGKATHGPREAQVARVAQTRVARVAQATRVHADAREGHHVVRGVGE